MAGGIDWFRWHHGSITDPKFQLIARKAGASFGDVIAVWAYILEQSSANADRGAVGHIDYETLDFLLGAAGGTSSKIVEAMTDRGLLEGGRVSAWERRQPKREDAGAAIRKREQRDRDMRDMQQITPSHDESHSVTPSHDREEKRREEEKEPPLTPPAGGRVRLSPMAEPDGFAGWYDLYRRKDARADAMKAWRQLNPDAETQERMQAALRVWPWSDRRELNPLPASWIRGRRWEDESVAKALGMARKRSPDWAAAAGFANVYEANNAGCFEHNAAQFRDGKRMEAA